MFFFLMKVACILGAIIMDLGGICCLGLIMSYVFGLPLWVTSIISISIVISSLVIGLFMDHKKKHALKVNDNYGNAIDEDDLF